MRSTKRKSTRNMQNMKSMKSMKSTRMQIFFQIPTSNPPPRDLEYPRRETGVTLVSRMSI